jgi:predicted  nucleic acid-binding Zn-ribbon protein
VLESLDHLIRLQDIDTQLVQIQTEKGRQPEQLEGAKRPLQMAQAELDQAKAAMGSALKNKRSKEQDLQTHEEHIEKLKARQSEIKTNKEYQAHLQELATAQQDKGRLEEALLLLMDELDAYQKRVGEEERVVKEREAELRIKEQELMQQSAGLDQAQAKLLADRAELIKKIPEKLLRDYERLKTARKDLAVVPILHGSCGGCHMNIPPQRVAEVKAGDHILTCSQCQRILYWPHSNEQSAGPLEVNPAPVVKNDSPPSVS